MNVLLYDDFAQLFFINDISLYSQFRQSNFEFLIVVIVYRVFVELIFLIKSMKHQKNSNFAQQFRQILNQMRNDSMFFEN